MMIVIAMPYLSADIQEARLHAYIAFVKAGISTVLHLFEDEDTRGFTRAVNRLLGEVMDLYDPRFVCLLNSDVVTVQEGWLARLLSVMQADDRYGFVAPGMACGTKPQNEGRPGMSGIQVVDHVNMSCALIRREVFDAVGFFDEAFVHFASDYDLQKRARALGWLSVWVRDVWVYHDWVGGRYPDWMEQDSRLFRERWSR